VTPTTETAGCTGIRLERWIREGENPVHLYTRENSLLARKHGLDGVNESGCLKVQPEDVALSWSSCVRKCTGGGPGRASGRYTPPKAKYMAAGRPIAHKYHEGKMKSTLKRESKELEVVEREAIEVGHGR